MANSRLMSISLAQLLFSLGIAQGLVISTVFLLSPYFRSRANNFLAATILCIALLGFLDLVSRRAETTDFVTIVNDIMWEYLVPATIYGYFVRLLAERNQALPIRWCLYLPFLVTLVINLIIDGGEVLQLYQLPFSSEDHWLTIYYVIEEIGTIVFCAAVLTHVYGLINKTETKPITKKWARECFLLFVVILLVWIATWLGSQVMNQNLSLAIWVTVSLIFSVLIYRGVFQFKLAEERFEIRDRLRNPHGVTENDKESEAKTTIKAVKADGSIHRQPKSGATEVGLPEKDLLAKESEEPLPIIEDTEQASDLVMDQYLVELDKLMSTGKLYRTATLSRSDVAELLGISPGYLSRKLAAHPAGNFTEYVNGYRVEEVKIMLSDPTFDDYSLAAIGLEAGFNSKSAFYKTFKSITRCTPSEYKAIIREEG